MSESVGEPSWAAPDQSATYRRNASNEDEESKPVLQQQQAVGEQNAPTVVVPPSNARTAAHKFFRIFKFLNMMTAFFVLVAQIVSVVYLPFDSVEIVIKLFVSSFCAMIIMNELETSKILKDSPLLWNWVPRGYFYAFIGIVSIEENNIKSEGFGDLSFAALASSYSATMFIEVTSWMMFAFGLFYILMGLLFGQRYNNKLREDYNNRISERKKMFGESGLRSNSFNIPIKHYGDAKGGVMS